MFFSSNHKKFHLNVFGVLIAVSTAKTWAFDTNTVKLKVTEWHCRLKIECGKLEAPSSYFYKCNFVSVGDLSPRNGYK